MTDEVLIEEEVLVTAPRVKMKAVILDGDLVVTVNPEVLDDWDLVELMEADQIAAGMRLILGDDQLQRVKDHYRDPESGRLKASVMGDVLKKILGKMAPNS